MFYLPFIVLGVFALVLGAVHLASRRAPVPTAGSTTTRTAGSTVVGLVLLGLVVAVVVAH